MIWNVQASSPQPLPLLETTRKALRLWYPVLGYVEKSSVSDPFSLGNLSPGYIIVYNKRGSPSSNSSTRFCVGWSKPYAPQDLGLEYTGVKEP